jgi:DNA-binding NtrC family response regulator
LRRTWLVVVHDDATLRAAMIAGLVAAGHGVDGFADPMLAWGTCHAGPDMGVLITGVNFPPGRSNGVALARMTVSENSATQVLFVTAPEFAAHTDGMGQTILLPAPVSDVVKAVARLLAR